MLIYSKEARADLLNGFECGVPVMDEFIRTQLDVFLKNDSRYSLYVAKNDDAEVVAFFVISSGIFVDCAEEYADLPFGKPWSYMDEDLQLQDGRMFPTLEIDYLAVRKDCRNSGIGRQVMSELIGIAADRNVFFLTVEAYHDTTYSAIPFYEKQGFFALQEYSIDSNTLRMAMRV